MIPIKLTIEGLYSYQKRQTIDFENLTSGGLFGILGSVGSGKSSILEAITYALYGETERLNSQDKRAYNMLNLKSDMAYIEFDFHNHENKTFRCVREFRRNSRRFEDVKAQNTVFYEKKSDNWIPLEHTNAEQLIGLSYKNFKRTIIIPQGQFKEFLELGAKDRTNMMMEIFGLHRFDLYNKVATLNSDNKSNLDQLQGRLQTYEFVTGEIIKEKSEEADRSEKQLNEIQKEFSQIDDQFRILKNLKMDFDELQIKNRKLSELTHEQPKTDEKEQQLNLYERIYKAFSHDMANLNRLQSESDKNKIDLKSKSTSLERLQNESLLKQKEIEKITPYFNILSQKRREENDLELIAQIINASSQILENEKRVEKGSQLVQKKEAEENEIKEEIRSMDAGIEYLKTKLIDSSILIDAGEWFAERKRIEELKEKTELSLEKTKTTLNKILSEAEDKLINPETFEEEINNALRELAEKKSKFEKQRDELMIQQKLADYSSELHEGKPCPLCGSTVHPEILHADDVSSQLRSIEFEMVNISQNEKALQNKRMLAYQLVEQKKQKEQEIESIDTELGTLAGRYKEHHLRFVWNEFDASNEKEFQEKKKQSFEIQKQISEKTKLHKTRQIDLENIQKELQKFRKALEEIKIEENSLKTKIEANKSNLKIVDFELYKQKRVDEIDFELAELKRNNDKIEADHKLLTNELNELKTKTASVFTLKESLQKKSEELEAEIRSLNQSLQVKLKEEKVDNLDDVIIVLSKQPDVAKERAEIQQFRLQYGILKNEVEILTIRLKEADFNDSVFLNAEHKWKEYEQKLESQKKSVVALRTELERLKKAFEEKLEIENKYAKLQKRAENLQIMINLFRGAGFVQYISSIYLSQLCDHANVRFHRMTRNQLRLQLNENNDFEIIDYLNEGRSRSVKTLSGGQAFQVSLSLALALAESVQTNAMAEKNFFFIDEGFGTQDQESVNIVFETLLNLNKENKIVGIISHVEELKERIPMTLTVTKDSERGSLIEVNR